MILITGATGRIGNLLTRRLVENGEDVRIFSRSGKGKSLQDVNVEVFSGDITNVENLKKSLEGIEEVFHLAGLINISNENRSLTYKINIEATKNIAKLCREKDIKLYYTSSIHAFDAPKDNSQINEETPLSTDEKSARGIYDYSKAVATQCVIDEISKGLNSIIFFPTGVIGPYDYTPSFFGSGMISLVKSNLSRTIDGKYDYVDVRDTVDAILKARELRKFGEKYILSGNVLTMGEYVNFLKEVTNINSNTRIFSLTFAKILGFFNQLFDKKSEITLYSVDTLNSNSNISNQKAKLELGFTPRSAKESIQDQYRWFVENKYI